MSLRITSNHSFDKFQKVISSHLCSNKLQIWSVAFLEPVFALESGRRDINLDALQKKQLQFREVSYKSTYCRIGLRHFHGYFQTFYSINLPRWNPLDSLCSEAHYKLFTATFWAYGGECFILNGRCLVEARFVIFVEKGRDYTGQII